MKDIIINVSRETSMVYLDTSTIGVDGENLQSKIIFKFTDTFVDGVGRLEYKINSETNYILLTNKDETYTAPVESVLTKEGHIDMQLVITQTETTDGIPIFKSNTFYMYVSRSINADEVVSNDEPSDSTTWITLLTSKIAEVNTKINEANNLDITSERVSDGLNVTITKKDGSKDTKKINDGTNATINGKSAINIIGGDNIDLEQSDDTLTINCTNTQINKMPSASSDIEGKIVQYTGTTTGSYTNGYFYQCQETVSENDEKLELSAGGISGLGNLSGNASTFGEKVDYVEDTFEFSYNGYPQTIKVYTSGDDAILTRSREDDVDNAYAWITPSDTIVYSSVQAPTDIDRFYSTTGLENFDEVNIYYSEDLTYSDSYGRWQTYDENMIFVDTNLSDYGISYDGVARIGAIIYATYTNATESSNEYIWRDIKVQDTSDIIQLINDLESRISRLEEGE